VSLSLIPSQRLQIRTVIVTCAYKVGRHSQWDYGNKWSMEGCDGGNCLRSHVGFMETYNTLAMITKAGVPSDKITVGIASYGRQFKMTDPSCTGRTCTFVGPESGATRGRCTDTPEYISLAEINEIIEQNPSAKVYKEDNGGASKYMTHDGNWVSYIG
jgi:GH18 family chitinase